MGAPLIVLLLLLLILLHILIFREFGPTRTPGKKEFWALGRFEEGRKVGTHWRSTMVSKRTDRSRREVTAAEIDTGRMGGRDRSRDRSREEWVGAETGTEGKWQQQR